MSTKEAQFIDISDAVLKELDEEYQTSVLKNDANGEKKENRQNMMRLITARIQRELFIRLIEGAFDHTELFDRFSDGILEMCWLYDVSDRKCRISVSFEDTDLDTSDTDAMYFRCHKADGRTEYRLAADLSDGTDAVIAVLKPFLDAHTPDQPVDQAIIQMRRDLDLLDRSKDDSDRLYRIRVIEQDIARIREILTRWPGASEILLTTEECADMIRQFKAELTARIGKKTKA